MILQEYLTRLGWSIDEPSFKKFAGALASTSARTAELGSAVLETTAAVELMVSRVARKYETLYYVAQRNQQSVKYIQQTQFAFQNIGLSAEGASRSIENIGAALRTQPWLKAIFGNASTPQEVASRLGKSGLPYFLQTRFAEMIGLDETTLLHLQKYAEIESAAEASFSRRQLEAGIDPEKLATASAAYGRALTTLESDLDILKDRIALDLLDPTQKAITNFDALTQWIARVDKATDGWVLTLGTLAGTAGGLLVVEKIVRRLLGFGATTTGGAVAGGAARVVGGAGAFSGASVLARTGLGAAIAGAIVVKQNDPAQKAYLRELLGPILYELGLSKSPDLTDAGLGGSAVRRYHRIGRLSFADKLVAGASAGDRGAGKSVFPNVGAAKVVGYGRASDRVNQVVDALTKAGYPLASAQGIAAGLFSESHLETNNPNPKSDANGIAQWLGARSKAFENQYLHSVGQGSFEEQLQFLIGELNSTEKATGDILRKGGLTSRGAAGAFIHGFERPGAAGEASDLRTAGPLADALSAQASVPTSNDNSKSVHLNNKVDVHLYGGGDALDTAKAVTGAMDKANTNALRNSGNIWGNN